MIAAKHDQVAWLCSFATDLIASQKTRWTILVHHIVSDRSQKAAQVSTLLLVTIFVFQMWFFQRFGLMGVDVMPVQSVPVPCRARRVRARSARDVRRCHCWTNLRRVAQQRFAVSFFDLPTLAKKSAKECKDIYGLFPYSSIQYHIMIHHRWMINSMNKIEAREVKHESKM